MQATNMSLDGKVYLPNVSIDEKIFVKVSGILYQGKVVGFRTHPSSCNEGGDDVAESLILWLGKVMGNKVFDVRMYTKTPIFRTVDDAVRDKTIDTIHLDTLEFARTYLNGYDFMLCHGRIVCYKWWNCKPTLCKFDNKWNSIEYMKHGVVRVAHAAAYNDTEGHYCYEWEFAGSIPQDIYQSSSECRANNAPTVVYLQGDDE